MNFFLPLFANLFSWGNGAAPISVNTIYEFTVETLDGREQALSEYSGKVVMIVNVASKCGLTPQYVQLQQIYDRYQERGLVILGFPANNFMGQEPGSNEQIAEFCQKNYGVSFPMFSKISVKGGDTHPLFQYLKQETGESPEWNFHKYLVNKQGKPVKSIAATTKPDDPAVIAEIERLLAE
jgi:glutathione peroxidase